MTTTRIMTFEVTVSEEWLFPDDLRRSKALETDGFNEIGKEIEKTALTHTNAANLRYIESFTEEEWDA